MIGKGKLVNNSLPRHLGPSNRNIFGQKTIANSLSMNVLSMLDRN